MENYGIIILIMGIMIGASAIADKLKVPVPVLLVGVGILIGFNPNMPPVELDPSIVMLIFLPPLLYDAAFNIPYQEFRTNINTIGTLAIGLVFLTTIGIAAIARYCIPGMTWPLGFVLGAILSATDAVAAMSITKGLGLPRRTTTILEGESLVNDASGLVAYRFAVAAVTGVAFVFKTAILTFLGVVAGGFLAGALMGMLLTGLIRLWRRNDMVVVISWSGMRGIVSLAIAFGLPEMLDDGKPFPMRNNIVFLSIAVVLMSVLGQGLTLPLVVRRNTRGKN